MRLALFSDIHSNYRALEAVLADMGRRGIDQRVCLGDITLKGPRPKECVDRIRDELKCPVVQGNTDKAYHPDFHPDQFPPQNESQKATRADFDRHMAALSTADQEWLYNLPLRHRVTVGEFRLDLFHATPTSNYVLILPWASPSELEALRPAPDTSAIAFGHCHRAFVRFVQGMLVINTGSVGIPFDGDPRPGYALVEADGDSISATIVRVPYDAEAAIRDARDADMAGWELFAYTARTGHFPG